MKRINWLLLILLLCTGKAYSQHVYQIRADSVRIYNVCDTAELIIENRTRGVSGYLYNKGDGRTEFRRIRLETVGNNQIAITGQDTLNLSSLSAIGGVDTIYRSGDNIVYIKKGVTYTINVPMASAGDFVQNQSASAQTASAWVSGPVISNSNFYVNQGVGGGTAIHFGLRSTGGLTRFSLGLEGSEAGSDSGANFNIWRYNDAGGFIGSGLSIERSTGNVGIGTYTPTSKLQVDGTIKANGVTLGAAGNTNAYSLELLRNIGSADRTARLTLTGNSTVGYGPALHALGTSTRLLLLPDNGTAPYFSDNGGTNYHRIWHENNHPAGIANNQGGGAGLTGPYVYSNVITNSAGHLTSVATRALTVGDIGAISSTAPASLGWNSFNGSTTAAFNASLTNAPSAASYFGINMPNIGNGAYGAQIAFRANAGYYRTLEAGTYGSWLQFADRGWTTANFAPISGSGNYINNSTALQSAVFNISGYGQVQKAGSNSFLATMSLMNSTNTRGVNFQLNADANSGLAIWIHNGSSWQRNLDLFSSGAFSFPNILSGTGSLITAHKKLLMPNFSGIAGAGTGNANQSYFSFYESDGVTRKGYVGDGGSGNEEIQLVSDVDNLLLQSSTGDIRLDATGVVTMDNLTNNHLVFNSAGVAAPTFSSRSAGTKVVLYPSFSSIGADYAMGIETNNIWHSVHQNTTTCGFKWYGGKTEVARLSGTGQLNIASTLDIGSIPARASAATVYLTHDGSGVVNTRTASQVLSDIGAAPASGSGNYIRNQFSSAQSSNFFISGTGRTTNQFSVARNGSNDIIHSLTLYDSGVNRGANFQLNGEAVPGLATWIHNGTTWVKRMEQSATNGLLRITADGGEGIHLFRPANVSNGGTGSIAFEYGNTTNAAVPVVYGQIYGIATTVTAGAENGSIAFNTRNAGTLGERLRIANTGDATFYGNVTLGKAGVTTPYNLGVTRSVSSVNYTARLNVGSAGQAVLTASNGTAASDKSIYLNFSGDPAYSPNGGTTQHTLWHAGNQPVATAGTANTLAKRDASGAVYATGFFQSSMAVLKENISDFAEPALPLINGLTIKEFTYKADNEHTIHFGIIADSSDWHFATKDHDRFDTNSSLAIAIKAVQELSKENEMLEHKVKSLEERLAKLEKLLE